MRNLEKRWIFYPVLNTNYLIYALQQWETWALVSNGCWNVDNIFKFFKNQFVFRGCFLHTKKCSHLLTTQKRMRRVNSDVISSVAAGSCRQKAHTGCSVRRSLRFPVFPRLISWPTRSSCLVLLVLGRGSVCKELVITYLLPTTKFNAQHFVS